MDGTRFDRLIKSMATTRVTRLTALRGLAVGAVAAAAGFAAPDEADAKCKKKCDQCHKKVKKKTKSGHVRCRCRAKPNGTLCSIPGATTTTTCLNGTCVAAVTPVPPVPPPPPGFNCNVSGCVGVDAGLICNTATGACRNCTSFTQCPGQICAPNGRCQGGETCANDRGCVEPLECRQGRCSLSTGPCIDTGADADRNCAENAASRTAGEFCLLGECVQPCAANPPICPGGETCTNGLCTL
jgi:hypothetical protein